MILGGFTSGYPPNNSSSRLDSFSFSLLSLAISISFVATASLINASSIAPCEPGWVRREFRMQQITTRMRLKHCRCNRSKLFHQDHDFADRFHDEEATLTCGFGSCGEDELCEDERRHRKFWFKPISIMWMCWCIMWKSVKMLHHNVMYGVRTRLDHFRYAFKCRRRCATHLDCLKCRCLANLDITSKCSSFGAIFISVLFYFISS